jgi:hypothetical protein
MPIRGIRTKPATHEPAMLPRVFDAYARPVA